MAMVCLQSCSAMSSHQKQEQVDQEFNDARQMIAQGHLDAGTQKLAALVQQYPDNVHYRNTLKMHQDLKVAQRIKSAEVLLKKGDLNDAESQFQSILITAPENQRALNGLKKVAIAQKHQTLLNSAEQAYAEQDFNTARALLRAILAEDTTHVEARTLFEKIDQQAMDKVNNVPQINSAFKQSVSLEFNNAPIKSVFEYIGKAGNLNFTFDRELSDSMLTSVILRNTPISDAIETILTTNQLGKKVLNENTLLIYPLSRSQQYQELYVRSFYLNNMDAEQAMALVKTVLQVEEVYIDENLNTLVMRDTLDSIKTAEKLITSQDLVEPEVMLEVEVMEVNRRNLEEIGIRYPTQIGLGVEGEDEVPGRLSLTELKEFNSDLGVFSITDPALALNLLHRDTDTNLLANPKIRVKNRDKAKIHVGDKVPVLTSVSNSTGFVSQSVSYIDVGIKLEVEPTILIQNQVSIEVELEVSNIIDQVTSNSGVLAYSIGSRNAVTTLQLNDGETQVLAGLFTDDRQNNTYKIPGLSNLPFIGRFFTDISTDKQKSEIVLLITPRILHNIVPANSVYTAFPSGVSQAARSAQMPQARPMPPVAQNPMAPIVIQTEEDEQERNATTAEEFARQIQSPGGM
ncbi:type II and III secretion system protein [Pseudidiomarina aestuarii]|uniref:Type II and III secretion system protein n=1 Tax=Pseudidiomarina aestuarii TaxID=624146 RepID=A0A2T4CY57_9GAMM|nr:type II and III secretion system protein [Pseudidiomarina aestuarii]